MTINGQFENNYKGYLQALDYLRANRTEPVRGGDYEAVIEQANAMQGIKPLREPAPTAEEKPKAPAVITISKKAKAIK